jgi:hypothetical protein
MCHPGAGCSCNVVPAAEVSDGWGFVPVGLKVCCLVRIDQSLWGLLRIFAVRVGFVQKAGVAVVQAEKPPFQYFFS